MVSCAVHTCGPVPSGGRAPVEFTVNFHCVPLGEITEHPPPTELQKRFIVKLPFTSVLEFCWPPICTGTLFTRMVGVPVDGTSCADTFAKLYGKPLGSVIVPVTRVGVCAFTGRTQARNSSTENSRTRVI